MDRILETFGNILALLIILFGIILTGVLLIGLVSWIIGSVF